MRVSQSEKANSHARIVASAARLVRENGVDATSVNDVMQDASLTHGGFYRHFTSKQALLAAALEKSFEEIFEMIEGALPERHSAGDRLADFQKFYLSDDHVAMMGAGCPVPAIAADVARRSPELKEAFGAGVTSVIDRLTGARGGTDSEKRIQAMRHFAMMAGAILIARASDPATAKDVLAACRGAEESRPK